MVSLKDTEIILAKLVYLINKFNIFYIERDHIEEIVLSLDDDKNSFLKKDPSTMNDSTYLLLSFSSFDSVVGYRLAHKIYTHYQKKIDGRKISEYFKNKLGIEIHPAAQIGKRFVIDHGVGSVIGETCIIGDDCYFLQKIILGSSKIAFNENKNRHPIIGNNVEIGGFVRIFGNVTIGNNVKISPHSIIKTNIPDNHSIVIKNNEQFCYLRKS